ncbi:MAG: hypothetical protein AB7P49_15395, partial [Bdellovibrionales bacterium]
MIDLKKISCFASLILVSTFMWGAQSEDGVRQYHWNGEPVAWCGLFLSGMYLNPASAPGVPFDPDNGRNRRPGPSQDSAYPTSFGGEGQHGVNGSDPYYDPSF